MEIGGGRLIGLGVGVRLGRRVTTLSAYMQDADSGSVAAVERAFADPPQDSSELPKSFADLSATVLTRGISLGSLAPQLLLKGGSRHAERPPGPAPHGRFHDRQPAGLCLGADQAASRPGMFGEELSALLESMPPAYLRPRRLTDTLHVCPIASVESVSFDSARERLTAVLRDAEGGEALLLHPFHTRRPAGLRGLGGDPGRSSRRGALLCADISRASRAA